MDDLFNFFNNEIFGKPVIRFQSPVKDMLPTYWTKWEEEIEGSDEKKTKGYKCIARAVGVSEEDLKVTIEDYGILIDGETTVDGYKFSQHLELPIHKDILANVESLEYQCKDGLVYLYMGVKEPDKPKVHIKKISR